MRDLPDSLSIDVIEGPNQSSQKAIRRHARKVARAEKQDRRNPKPITPRNEMQATYMQAMEQDDLVFAIGPAGVGKTYVAARMFGHQLAAGIITKLYIARPNVSLSRHKNGYLPGTLEDKTAPWLVPIMEGIKESMSASEFDRFRRAGAIEEVPFEYIQGRTFKNAACIVDEAENLSLDDLYITLTRQGEDLTMVLAGDIAQSRINDSGLATVIEMATYHKMTGVSVVEFSEADVVRSEQAKQWVKAFRSINNLHNAQNCANNLPAFITQPVARSAA